MSVGPAIITPESLPTRGTRLRAHSSFSTNCSSTPRPLPPYSLGQAGAIQPCLAIRLRHSPNASRNGGLPSPKYGSSISPPAAK